MSMNSAARPQEEGSPPPPRRVQADPTSTDANAEEDILLPFPSFGELLWSFPEAVVSLTCHCLEFWRDVLVIATSHHMKPSELRLVSIVLLSAHFLFAAALGTDGVWSILLRPFGIPDDRRGDGAAPDVSPLVLSLFVGVAVISTAALILSTHMWLHLLSRIAEDPDPPALAVAGIAALLVTQSIFPCVLVMNGAYACWTGDLLWLCGGVLTSVLWAMPTVGLFGTVRERFVAPDGFAE